MSHHQPASNESPLPKRYYITTAIDYPNAPPHIGHALEKVAADIGARFQRLQNAETLFSMGLDENSQHVVTAARGHLTEPQIWLDQMDQAFRQNWDALEVSYDAWVRTTTDRHSRAAAEIFRRAQANGAIYQARYAGWYCPNCNTFYSHDELVEGHCPVHLSLTPDWLEEENYFFALTKYADQLLDYIQTHPDFIVPESRKAEILGLLRTGLRDFSASRLIHPEVPAWGIPVPDDPGHVLYVWFDALTNYLTAVGFPDDLATFARFWPADVHVIGKDVTRFHCLYWPAMLLAAELPLPRQIAVHGFVTLEGQRISKTTGNTIDPLELVARYGADPVRYYLARNLSFASDGDFRVSELERAYQSELANDLGNLLNRVVTMTTRYRQGQLPATHERSEGPREAELRQSVEVTREQAAQSLRRWEINQALATTWGLVRRANQYLEASEPWRLARQPAQAQQLGTVLWTAAEVTRLLAILLAPYIPAASDRILAQLGQKPIKNGDWLLAAHWEARPLTQVVPGPLLFPRLPTSPTDAPPSS